MTRVLTGSRPGIGWIRNSTDFKRFSSKLLELQLRICRLGLIKSDKTIVCAPFGNGIVTLYDFLP